MSLARCSSFHLQRRLWTLSSSIEFGSRGSPSTFSDDDFCFALVDRVWLEGLAVYLRRRRLWLGPCRQSSARGARHLASVMMASALPSSIEFGSRCSPSTFGDDDFAFALVDRVRLEGLAVYLRRRRLRLRPRRQSSARGAHRLPSATTASTLPSSTEFSSRGSPSTFGDDDFAFALINRVRLEGLAIYLRR